LLEEASEADWYSATPGEDWRRIAADVDRCLESGDHLLFNYTLSELAFDYYATNNSPHHGFSQLPVVARLPSFGVAMQREVDKLDSSEALFQWVRKVELNPPSNSRMWLVNSH
jgi:hypothetical protein